MTTFALLLALAMQEPHHRTPHPELGREIAELIRVDREAARRLEHLEHRIKVLEHTIRERPTLGWLPVDGYPELHYFGYFEGDTFRVVVQRHPRGMRVPRFHGKKPVTILEEPE